MTSTSLIDTAEQTRDFDEWMKLALDEARVALNTGEAPIGAVVIGADGQLLGAGHNTLVLNGNPTVHAEINAFAAAFPEASVKTPLTMVSTLEPCVMCTGAAMQAGVTTIVYGLQAPADSGTGRVTPPSSPGATAPRVVGGIAAGQSRELFAEWLARHEGDDSREDQRKFVIQLLALTGPSMSGGENDGT